MMRTFYYFLLTAAGIAVLSGPALTEATPKKAAPPKATPKKTAPPKAKGNLLDLLGAADMLGSDDMPKTAADLRKAGEAFERFGNTLEAITPSITKGLVEGSENLGSMGHAFDPLGLKTAFTIIQEQSEKIYALQQAEIERLEEECERLRKELAQQPPKTKNQKNGRQ